MKTRLALLFWVVGVAGAQSPGTFTATGNMTTSRWGHTATLLADGRVLIAGGATGGAPPFAMAVTATAELYDPSTGTFTATGNMTIARWGHTATLLPDGRVLIADLASAELYDPAAGTFTTTANLTAPSLNGSTTATLLLDGRVLVTGYPFGELYDPGLGAFTVTGNMTGPPSFATATLLPDGRVLLAAYGAFSTKTYDPGTGMFSVTGSQTGFELRANLLPNGEVLVTGGNNDPGPAAYSEVYDPSTGVFADTGNMMAPRADHTATLLPDGKTLITGGSTWIVNGPGMYYSCCLSSAELYNALTGSFTIAGSMVEGRTGHTATLLTSGMVLIAGGDNTVELYVPVTPIPAPLLFALSGDGTGPGVIWHADTGQIASPQNPAGAGDVLATYTTSLVEGGVIPPQIAVGGRLAQILYFGAAPGYPGYYQVNFVEPKGVAPGPAVPVRLTYIGRPSNEVTIGAQ